MKENPDLFNRKAVVQRFLKQIKVPGINELMPDTPAPEKADSANENVAMSVGQSAFAYPEQDHLSHIQAHLDFAKDPVFGQNPVIAPTFLPRAVEHIKQHIVLWYLGRMNGWVQKSFGKPIEEYGLLDDPKKLDRLYGAASQHVLMDSEETLKGTLPVIQQMIKALDQFKPKPELTPDAQVLLQTSMAETERRKQRDAIEMQLKGQDVAGRLQLAAQKQMDEKDLAIEELQLRLAIAENDQQTKERIEAARLTRDAARLKQDGEKFVLDHVNKGAPYGYQ